MYDYTLPHPASEYLRLLYVLKRQAARVTYWNAMGGAALVGTLPLLVWDCYSVQEIRKLWRLKVMIFIALRGI